MNWRRLFTRKRITGLLIAVATGWISVELWPATDHDLFIKQPFVGAERLGFDALFAIRGAREDRIDERIAVVGFTRESERNLEARWPLKRSMHAKLIDILVADGAKLIVYDALFSDKTNPEEDKALDAALKRAKNVVIAQRIDRNSIQRSKSIEFPYYDDPLGIDFEAESIAGVAEVILDGDDVIRSFVPTMKFQDQWAPALATAAYMKLNELPREALSADKDGVKIGTKRFGPAFGITKDSVDGSPIVSLLMDFPAGMDAFDSTYSYDQVFQGKFPRGSFKGKIVFVGVSGFELARELDDIYTISSTQLAMQSGVAAAAANTRSADFGRVPGVFIQAHFLNALTMNGFITLVPRWLQGIAVTLFTLFGIAVARRYYNWRGPVFVVGLGFLYFFTAIGLFEYRQIQLPYVVPLVLFAFAVGLTSWLERAGLKKRWSGYVSADVLEQILKSEAGDLAKRYDAVAMFGDIRGFTAFSDKRDPELVVKLLNRHFERFSAEIFEEKGAIDKFMGDGVLVVFGAPIKIDAAELRAVRAALKMRDVSLQPMHDDGEDYIFATGFGIAKGPFVAGHVGSKRRHDFTVIGDVVNTAARLQGVTGEPDVIIDEATYKAVADFVTVDSLGPIVLKGKELPVQCYKVIGLKTS